MKVFIKSLVRTLGKCFKLFMGIKSAPKQYLLYEFEKKEYFFQLSNEISVQKGLMIELINPRSNGSVDNFTSIVFKVFDVWYHHVCNKIVISVEEEDDLWCFEKREVKDYFQNCWTETVGFNFPNEL